MTYAYPCLSNPEYLCFQAEVGHYDIYKADRPCDTQDYDLHDEQEVGVEGVTAGELRLLRVASRELVTDTVQELHVALLRVLLHGRDKGP